MLQVAAILAWILAIAVTYRLFWQESRRDRLLQRIPGAPSLPLFGNALDLNVSNDVLFRFFQFIMAKFPGVRKLRLFSRTYVLLGEAAAAQKVLSSNLHIDKSSDYDMIKPWLGTGLLTSQGQKWHQRRKMLTPAFHFKILDEFLEVFNEQSDLLVRILQKEFGDGQAFDIFPYVTRCTLDVICETAMGRKINAQEERDSDYVKAIYRISELIQHRQMRPWLHPNVIWRFCPSGREEERLLKVLHGFTEKVIRERKREFKLENIKSMDINDNYDSIFMKGTKDRIAFLDIMLRAQAEAGSDKLTDTDIREEVDTLMFEGHDTTAANLSWTIFLLGSHPEYQAKVHEELDDIFEGDKERPITTRDMSQMKYLECCIKESLRMYPSVPIIARDIKTDLHLDDETVMPAGTTAFIMPYQLHHDRTVFPEPEAFYPDRFFPHNCAGRNPFAYVPFSAGPRNCIGQKFAMMEEKIVLANFFRHFKVVAAERREDIILLAELIMRPKHGLSVKIMPRA